MMRYIYIILLLLSAGVFFSCGGSDDPTVDEAWKSTNEEAFAALTYKSEYSRIMSESNMGHIYYKILKEGTGDIVPYYTDTVKAYYTGCLITDSVFDSAEPPYKAPILNLVSGFIDGFTTALQHMRTGDRWEVWIPQELGYGAVAQTGSTGKTSIPAYSTLKFEIELVSVKRKGSWLQ